MESFFKNIFKVKYLRGCLLKRRLKASGSYIVVASDAKIIKAGNVSLGNNVRIGERCLFHAVGGLTVGDNVSFGPEVFIWTDNHNYMDPLKLPYDENNIKNPVVIEDNVWIGARVSILPGVTIGEGAVIGMGAVVTKDIPPFALAVGNPAKVIKYRDIDKYKFLKEMKQFILLG